MLQHLYIKNYALIDTLNIDLHRGFSVITGETGAGKSIILGALGLLLGKRTDMHSIKKDETKCTIEGTFDIEHFDFHHLFEENDLDNDGKQCLLRREITSNGKSRSFINDTPVTLNVLRQFGLKLIDIHSQHQNLLLGNPDFIVDMVDSYSGNEPLRQQYEAAYAAYVDAKSLYYKEQKLVETKRQELDFLQYQFNQLSEANLKEGEQSLLEDEQNILAHAEEIKSQLYKAESFFGNEDSEGILSMLRKVEQSLSAISNVHKIANTLSERIDSSLIELRDVYDEIRSSQEDIIVDASRMSIVEERLNLLYSLEQKFSVSTVEDLIAQQTKFENEIQTIENSDEKLLRLKKQMELSYEKIQEYGAKLTARRKSASSEIRMKMLLLLEGLGMPNAALDFSYSLNVTPTNSGFDTIKFLFSSNKTLVMQEADKIASGGEIARLMLSLKTIVSAKVQLPTIIFDEIDTGVSGKMADKMALTMSNLSNNCQVISITHLPQIASMGSHHYKVYKQDNANFVSTNIVELSAEERVVEVANMLSGSDITEAAMINAKELLKKTSL